MSVAREHLVRRLASPTVCPKESLLAPSGLITVLSAGSAWRRRPTSRVDRRNDMTRMHQAATEPAPPSAVSTSRVVFGGIDTHKELHVAAVVDSGEVGGT